jgi:hypothetical protein
LQKAAKFDVSKAGLPLLLPQAVIPVFNLRALGSFVDITRTFESIDAQRAMYRAEVSVTNAVPRVSEAAQLRFALQTVAGNNLHFEQGAAWGFRGSFWNSCQSIYALF